jgi:hypothetical protein
MVELVKDPNLEKLLVRNAHLHWIALRASLLEPGRYERDIIASSRRSRSLIERFRCPVEVYRTNCPLIE